VFRLRLADIGILQRGFEFLHVDVLPHDGELVLLRVAEDAVGAGERRLPAATRLNGSWVVAAWRRCMRRGTSSTTAW
jgi:hypothetical protein